MKLNLRVTISLISLDVWMYSPNFTSYDSRLWDSIRNKAKLTHFNESVTVRIKLFEIIFLASKNLFYCNLSYVNSMKEPGTGKHRIRSTGYTGRLSRYIEFSEEISIRVYSEMILIFSLYSKIHFGLKYSPCIYFRFWNSKSVNRRNPPFLKTRKIDVIGLRIQCFYVVSFPVPSKNSNSYKRWIFLTTRILFCKDWIRFSLIYWRSDRSFSE